MITIRDVHVLLQSFEELRFKLSRAKLNYLDLSVVPTCYMHAAVKELVAKTNKCVDKAFYYNALLNKLCQSTQWNQEGTLEAVDTDPFSDDANEFINEFVIIRTELQDIAGRVRTLPSCLTRKPGFEKIDPMEIFNLEEWRRILNAVYILGVRAEAVVAIKPIVEDILSCVGKIVTIVSNIEVDHEKICIGGHDDAQRGDVLYPSITLPYQKERVFFSEEELERLRKEEEARIEQEARNERQRQLEKEVGAFRKELWDLLRQESIWEEREQKYIKLLFPEAKDKSVVGLGVGITEDAGLFLETFKKLICGHTDQPTNLHGQLSSFFHAFSAHEGGAGYSISRDWMSDKELNSLVKFFIKAGLTVTAMQTITELDGTLALTALHSKEVILVTK